MAGGGYDSDLNLNNVRLLGDFPIEHSLGGHGIADSQETNKYNLTLNPPITHYRIGLTLNVIFSVTNEDSATINVDNQGEIAIKKIIEDVLVDVSKKDIVVGKVYLLVFDGQAFQIVNNYSPGIIAFPISSENSMGLIEIATQTEVNAGTDNQRAVTPQKLAQYVADKVTGLWDDKGILDCSLNPNYPAALKGDAYTVSLAGKVGGAVGTDVQVRDVIYCTANNPGGTELTVGASWNVIQGNLVQATTVLAGVARIATQAEITAGLDDTKFVTPLKLITLLNSKKMRTQIRFQSDSLPDSQVLAAGSADYHFGIIAVGGIPIGSTIRQASLSWEGYIRNLDAANANSFDTGNIAMQRDGGPFSNYLNVTSKLQLGPEQVTFFRYVEDDVKNLATGNGTYLAKFANLSALAGSIAIAGHWTLEIDYETP
ncbi:MAG: hypothetical protein Q7W13_00450 [Bacteroidia bacterium]|nr:hypothetical protein [Bacteroidia bacterium]